MKRSISIILSVVLFSLLLLPFPAYSETGSEASSGEQDLTLHAQSAVLIDAASGRVLYGKNELQKRPMASTTKIMTCILALETGNPEDVVTASQNAAAQPKVHLGVSKGQTFYLKDLLYSLMLESHNDAAVMIAEHIGGSVAGFAAMMNQKARELGCYDTCFITPNGLDAETAGPDGEKQIHSTTAADLARIMRYCVLESPRKEQFLEITQTQNYYFTDIDKKHSYNCTNHNALLSMMNGALSGKTGFTGGAGYSYVGALEDDGRTFVVALLGCGWPPHKTWKWADTRLLFQYGMKNYSYEEVFRVTEWGAVPVADAVPRDGELGGIARVELTMNLKKDEMSLRLLKRKDEKVTIKEDIPKELTAPVREGEAVGSVSYYLEGRLVKSYPVYAAEEAQRISFGWCLKKTLEKYLSLPDCVNFLLCGGKQ